MCNINDINGFNTFIYKIICPKKGKFLGLYYTEIFHSCSYWIKFVEYGKCLCDLYKARWGKLLSKKKKSLA